MEHFWIDAAGLPAEITAQHPLTRRLCRDYEIAPPQSPAVLTACAEPETAMRLADGAASPPIWNFSVSTTVWPRSSPPTTGF